MPLGVIVFEVDMPHLGQFFVESHPAEQIVHPERDVESRVLIGPNNRGKHPIHHGKSISRRLGGSVLFFLRPFFLHRKEVDSGHVARFHRLIERIEEHPPAR